MLPDMGPHAVFIWSSYAIFATVLAGLIGWLILDGRRHAADLAKLERRAADSK
jgi:heme exporter protein D